MDKPQGTEGRHMIDRDAVLPTPTEDQRREAAIKWQGLGPAPRKWVAKFVRNDGTVESIIVYRSWKDYCDD